MTAFMSTLQAVHGTAPDPPCGEFDIQAVAEDGTWRKVPLASVLDPFVASAAPSLGAVVAVLIATCCYAAGGGKPGSSFSWHIESCCRCGRSAVATGSWANRGPGPVAGRPGG